MRRRVIGTGMSLLLAVACATDAERSPLPDELLLVEEESRIWFTGIKNNEVAVPGSFSGLRGALSIERGTGWVEIPLGALDTGHAERDQNIRLHLFEAPRFPSARLTMDSVSGAEGLPELGASIDVKVLGTLDLRGARIEITAPVRIRREAPRRLRVTTLEPILLTADELGLRARLAVLQAVCGHAAVSGVVPIGVDLVFEEGL